MTWRWVARRWAAQHGLTWQQFEAHCSRCGMSAHEFADAYLPLIPREVAMWSWMLTGLLFVIGLLLWR